MDEILQKLLIIIGVCTVMFYGLKFTFELLEILMKEGDSDDKDIN